MIDVYNKDAILNEYSISKIAYEFVFIGDDIISSINRDLIKDISSLSPSNLKTVLQRDLIVDTFHLYMNKIIAVNNIMINSFPPSTNTYIKRGSDINKLEFFIMSKTIKDEFKNFLIFLNNPVNFEYCITLMFLTRYTDACYYSFCNYKVTTNNEVNENIFNNLLNLNDLVKGNKEAIHNYGEYIKFYYPFICALFDIKEVFDGSETSTMYNSLSNDITYDHLLKRPNFVVNKKQLESKKKFFEIYMKKEIPDLYDTGVVKIFS